MEPRMINRMTPTAPTAKPAASQPGPAANPTTPAPSPLGKDALVLGAPSYGVLNVPADIARFQRKQIEAANAQRTFDQKLGELTQGLAGLPKELSDELNASLGPVQAAVGAVLASGATVPPGVQDAANDLAATLTNAVNGAAAGIPPATDLLRAKMDRVAGAIAAAAPSLDPATRAALDQLLAVAGSEWNRLVDVVGRVALRTEAQVRAVADAGVKAADLAAQTGGAAAEIGANGLVNAQIGMIAGGLVGAGLLVVAGPVVAVAGAVAVLGSVFWWGPWGNSGG